MSEDSMLKCLIAFILGFLISRMMQGNGFHVGGETECYNRCYPQSYSRENLDNCIYKCKLKMDVPVLGFR